MSVATVSKVVNQKPKVNESTRQRVAKALEEYNYVPDNTARSLKTRRTQTIGVVIPSITNIRFTYLLDGIKSELLDNGYKMLLCIYDADARLEAEYLSYLSHNHSDGIILSVINEDAGAFNKVLEKGKSIVCINNLPNTNATFDAVITDNIKTSEIAVNYLYGLGHRRIALIASGQNITTSRDRTLGYQRALERLGIPLDEGLTRIGTLAESHGYDSMRDLIAKAPDLTAVYVTGVSMTIGAVRAILDSGKKIPGDISIIGTDMYDTNGLMQPKITSVCQQNERIGKFACRQLLDSIHDPGSHTHSTTLLQPELIIRESCKNINDRV